MIAVMIILVVFQIHTVVVIMHVVLSLYENNCTIIPPSSLSESWRLVSSLHIEQMELYFM